MDKDCRTPLKKSPMLINYLISTIRIIGVPYLHVKEQIPADFFKGSYISWSFSTSCWFCCIGLKSQDTACVPSISFHFDEFFTTIPNLQSGEIPESCKQLVNYSSELVMNENFNLALEWT